jgi:pimeloyl-ACP methyl ester carboxylesterase
MNYKLAAHARRRLRTKFGALALATSLAVVVALPGTASASTSASHAVKPTIVLVHGAWADGSSWAPVTKVLQHAGYNVLVPPNPLRGLAGDSAYLSAYIEQATTGPVLLVGHSYGGAVISNAALSDPRVEGLVYVDAFVPDAGESVGQLVAQSKSALNVADPTTLFNLVAYPGAPSGDFDAYLKPTAFEKLFANGLPTAETRVLAAGQKPIALSALGAPATSAAWKSLPSWYIVGTVDKVLPEATQIMMAKRAGSKITKVNAPHLAMYARPLVIAHVIEAAAKSIIKK